MASDGSAEDLGGGGAATVAAGDAASTVAAGDGVATVAAGDGASTVAAGDAASTVEGGNSNDSIDAGNSNDSIDAGNSNDSIIPDAYTLTAPDGAELDPAAIEMATPVFKELGLTNDAAQKITSLYAENVLPHVAAVVEAGVLKALGLSEIANWPTQVKADPELGGANYEQNLTVIAQGRDAVTTPALREFFETSRLGNHPEVLRMFHKVGLAVAEGTFISGGTGQPTNLPLHKTLYGEEFQAKG